MKEENKTLLKLRQPAFKLGNFSLFGRRRNKLSIDIFKPRLLFQCLSGYRSLGIAVSNLIYLYSTIIFTYFYY